MKIIDEFSHSYLTAAEIEAVYNQRTKNSAKYAESLTEALNHNKFDSLEAFLNRCEEQVLGLKPGILFCVADKGLVNLRKMQYFQIKNP